MEAAVKNEFQFVRGKIAMFPYVAKGGIYNEETLIVLYNRLKSEGLWDIVFHENPNMGLMEFMNFFSSPANLMQVFSLVDGDKFIDMVGMAWVSEIVSCGGILNRAAGSMVYFKEYQKPAFTDQCSKIVLDYWYNQLGIDTVYGVTPESNRSALLYVKRSGFKEVGRVPAFTTLNGEINDGVITCLTKQEFNSSTH